MKQALIACRSGLRLRRHKIEWVKSSYEFGDPVPIIAIMYLALSSD